jgi:hypothetical protein
MFIRFHCHQRMLLSQVSFSPHMAKLTQSTARRFFWWAFHLFVRRPGRHREAPDWDKQLQKDINYFRKHGRYDTSRSLTLIERCFDNNYLPLVYVYFDKCRALGNCWPSPHSILSLSKSAGYWHSTYFDITAVMFVPNIGFYGISIRISNLKARARTWPCFLLVPFRYWSWSATRTKWKSLIRASSARWLLKKQTSSRGKEANCRRKYVLDCKLKFLRTHPFLSLWLKKHFQKKIEIGPRSWHWR